VPPEWGHNWLRLSRPRIKMTTIQELPPGADLSTRGAVSTTPAVCRTDARNIRQRPAVGPRTNCRRRQGRLLGQEGLKPRYPWMSVTRRRRQAYGFHKHLSKEVGLLPPRNLPSRRSHAVELGPTLPPAVVGEMFRMIRFLAWSGYSPARILILAAASPNERSAACFVSKRRTDRFRRRAVCHIIRKATNHLL
jgi:hypothetical protein